MRNCTTTQLAIKEKCYNWLIKNLFSGVLTGSYLFVQCLTSLHCLKIKWSKSSAQSTDSWVFCSGIVFHNLGTCCPIKAKWSVWALHTSAFLFLSLKLHYAVIAQFVHVGARIVHLSLVCLSVGGSSYFRSVGIYWADFSFFNSNKEYMSLYF